MAKRSTKISVVLAQTADVYLSCSWQTDKGRDVSWSLISRLDEKRIACVGDVKVPGDQDPKRIERILNETSGFAVILPHRDTAWTTSEFIWQELQIAAARNIPILLLVDERIEMILTSVPGSKTQIAIAHQTKLPPVEIENANLLGPLKYDAKEVDPLVRFDNQFERFVELTSNKSATHTKPFVFLSTRLKSDFGLAREAVAAGIEESVGMPCLWADSARYSTTIEGIYERAKFLIKECQFVVADLTFGPESPEYDSPSRAHEIGMAEAYEKTILATAQEPRRDPYFSASTLQLSFWNNEQGLYSHVKEWGSAPERLKIYGRRVYNNELEEAQCKSKPFSYDARRRYIAPNANPLSMLESTVVAVGFAMIALAVSFMASDFLKFDDTFDFASIVAALTTLVFASDMNMAIRVYLGRWAPLRWLIPGTGIALLMVWAALRFGAD